MAIFIRKSYTNLARIFLLNLPGKKWSIYQIKMFKPLIFVLFAITTGTLNELNATFLFNSCWCLLPPAPGSILCSNLFHNLATKVLLRAVKSWNWKCQLQPKKPASAPQHWFRLDSNLTKSKQICKRMVGLHTFAESLKKFN